MSFLGSFNSFRVFDREDEGEAYAEIAKQISTDLPDINIIGQPNLHLELQERLCPGYNYTIPGNVRVCWSSLIVECCNA